MFLDLEGFAEPKPKTTRKQKDTIKCKVINNMKFLCLLLNLSLFSQLIVLLYCLSSYQMSEFPATLFISYFNQSETKAKAKPSDSNSGAEKLLISAKSLALESELSQIK